MNQQLNLFDTGSETKLVSLPNDGSETKTAKYQALQRFLDAGQKEPIPCVNKYQCRGTKNLYFRVSYRQGDKKKHLHIPGGNTLSKLAQYRAGKLQEMINRGAELPEIIAAVQTYRSGGKNLSQ